MLVRIVQRLDAWITSENLAARADGLPTHSACTIKLLGQMALLERAAPLHLVATHDVNVYADYGDAVRHAFRRFLQEAGKELDAVGHEVWMPRETRYDPLFRGSFVTFLVADTEAVLVSKALKAPQKNARLLTEYLAAGPSERFMQLAKKYRVTLERFL